MTWSYCFHRRYSMSRQKKKNSKWIWSLGSLYVATLLRVYKELLGCFSLLKFEIGSKILIIMIFRQELRNDESKKGLFLIHFHRNDPQYRRYPGERITRLLMMLQICWSFILLWTVSSRILREDESNKISTEKVTCMTHRQKLAKLCSSFVSI